MDTFFGLILFLLRCVWVCEGRGAVVDGVGRKSGEGAAGRGGRGGRAHVVRRVRSESQRV
jgi:hypothetical protein